MPYKKLQNKKARFAWLLYL